MRDQKGIGLGLLVACSAIWTAIHGQDLRHPREMSLPKPSFSRPDPVPLQLRLENGLTAYVVEDRRVPLVTLTAFVGLGYADGYGPALSLKRSWSRGPGDTSADTFQETLFRLAAEYEVLMTAEESTIRLQVPSEDADEGLRLLAKIVQSAPVPETNAGGTPRSSPSLNEAVRLFRERLLSGHPYGEPTSAAPQRPPMSRQEFKIVDQESLKAFQDRFVVPSNVTLAVSGHFDAGNMRRAIRGEWGAWEGDPAPERQLFDPVRTEAPRRVYAHQAEKLQGWVVMGHELPIVPGADWAPLEVMNYILGGGHFDTRLFRVTRDRRGLTNDDSGFLEPSVRGPGLYTFRTYGRPEVVRLLIDLTLEEIQRIRDEPVTDEELFVAKGALADGVHAMRFEDGHATARTFAREWLRYRDHSRSESYPERIRAVTTQQVQQAARKYLHPDRMIIVVLGPIERIRNAPALEGEKHLEDYGTVTLGHKRTSGLGR